MVFLGIVFGFLFYRFAISFAMEFAMEGCNAMTLTLPHPPPSDLLWTASFGWGVF
jgi:hypothetical protein